MEQVESEHRDFVSALKETEEIDLSVTGRVSGHKTTRPVWFVQEGEKLYLVPVSGSDSEWYKNALKNSTVTLTANEITYTTKVRPIKDPAKVREVVEKFRAKYGPGEIRKYYSKRRLGGLSGEDQRLARGKRVPECIEESENDRSTRERDPSSRESVNLS